MQEPGVRQAPPEGPELLVECDRVHRRPGACPAADGVAEVARVEVVRRWMLPAGIHRDPLPGAVLPVDQDDAIELGLLDELGAVGRGEETDAPGRLTAC